MQDKTRRGVLASAVAAGAAATVGASAPQGAVEGSSVQDGKGSPQEYDWTEAELKDRKRVLSVGFTEQEADGWLLLNRGAAVFLELPEQHPSDLPEAVEAIHLLQGKYLARPTYRKYRQAAEEDGSAGRVF